MFVVLFFSKFKFMSRSLKKGPFVSIILLNKIKLMSLNNQFEYFNVVSFIY